MKKTDCSNQLPQYLTQITGGMFAGLLFLAAIASCAGLVGNVVELVSVLALSIASSILCVLASHH